MASPNREQRQICWSAKDEFWNCVENNDGDVSKCQKFRKVYESKCSRAWVKYFDNRREFEKYKKKMELGFDPIDNKQTAS